MSHGRVEPLPSKPEPHTGSLARAPAGGWNTTMSPIWGLDRSADTRSPIWSVGSIDPEVTVYRLTVLCIPSPRPTTTIAARPRDADRSGGGRAAPAATAPVY